MDTRKFIRVLIKILAGLMLIAAVIIILVNKGVIEFVSSEDAQKKPNVNFTATIEEEADDGKVSVEPNTNTNTTGSQGAGVSGMLAGALDGIDGRVEYVAQPLELGADYKTEFADFLAKYTDTRGPVSARGVYIPGQMAGDEESIDQLISLIDRTDLNAVVIDVKDDMGNITFETEVESRFDVDTEKNYVSDMKTLIDRLHDEGIYCVARIVTFKDPVLAEAKPEWSLHNSDGTIYQDSQGAKWVNPYCTDVWEYIYEVSDSAVAAGFDEIQYDYIRFSTGSGMDKVDFGDKAKYVSKVDVISQFLSGAYMRLAPKGVYVAADIFGTVIMSKYDGELIGQDFIAISQYCDYVCPMIYPSHFGNGTYGIDVPDANPHDTVYAVISDAMRQYENAMNNNEGIKLAKIRPWLQAFSASWLDEYVNYEGKHLKSQVRGLNDLGMNDWYAWNGAGSYENFYYGLVND